MRLVPATTQGQFRQFRQFENNSQAIQGQIYKNNITTLHKSNLKHPLIKKTKP